MILGAVREQVSEIAPSFGSDSAATIERIRRDSQSYLEDFAIEERSKMA